MTKQERRFLEILGENVVNGALNGHLDLGFEINKSLSDLEFEENCAAMDEQFKEDCKVMDAEYELSVAKMRAEHKAEVARIEATGTFKKRSRYRCICKARRNVKIILV